MCYESAGELGDLADELFLFGFEEFAPAVGEEAFCGREAEQFVEEFLFGNLLDEEAACGEVDAAYGGGLFLVETDGGEEIFFPGVEEHVVGECAGGNDSDDVALNDAFCGFRVFDLFADGDFVTGL